MKKLIRKILYKFGFVPIGEVRIAELNINFQWKKIILNKVQLKIEQEVARKENQLKKDMAEAFYFGNGTMKAVKFKMRKNKGILHYISL